MVIYEDTMNVSLELVTRKNNVKLFNIYHKYNIVRICTV